MSGFINEGDIEWVSELVQDNLGREQVMPVAHCHGSEGDAVNYCDPDVPCGLCRAFRLIDKLRAQMVRDAHLAEGLAKMQELADEAEKQRKQYKTAISVLRERGAAVEKALQADAAAMRAVVEATGVVPPYNTAFRDTTLLDFNLGTVAEIVARCVELHPFRLLLMVEDLRSDAHMEWSANATGPSWVYFKLKDASIAHKASEIVYIAHGARTVLKAAS